MDNKWKTLPTPAVTINMNIVEKNIEEMLKGTLCVGIKHRPHIKTHRSSFFAKMQVEAGCCGVTVAKLGEAEVMEKAGIKDIFVAYPIIGEDKLSRLLALSEHAKLITIVNSYVGAKALSDVFQASGKKIDVLIELDGGLNRGGVKPGKSVLAFANEISGLKGIHIIGLMYYGGLVYDSHNKEEIRNFAKQERDVLTENAKMLMAEGFCMEVLSAGSSFTGKFPEDLEGITECRSGHYIFNDCGQLDVGLAEPENCALRVIATIVSKPDEHVVIADVGTKSLTSDRCHHRLGYGFIIGHPEIEIYSLNEEHAFLRCEGKNSLQIGEKIEIIPNHACVVTNLVDEVYGFRDGMLEQIIKIDARGKSV